METCLDKFRSKLAVRGINGQQPAAHDTLRGTTFVDIDMSCLGAHHSFVGTAHGIDRKNVGTCTIEDKIDLGLRAEAVTEKSFRASTPFVVAIGQSMVGIRVGDGFHYFRAYARVII